MKICAFSDTHAYHKYVALPDADVLVFAGDFMSSGYSHAEGKNFADWFSNQKHQKKILVAGNHDRMLETDPEYVLSLFCNVIYLENSGVEIGGFTFWGSPQTPEFNEWAFNVPRGHAIKRYWDAIPDNTDVLITHGPPYGILDKTIGWGAQNVGCEELRKRVEVVRPKVHIFGHIHNGYGRNGFVSFPEDTRTQTRFFNVSICNEAYRPVNQPQLIDIA